MRAMLTVGQLLLMMGEDPELLIETPVLIRLPDHSLADAFAVKRRAGGKHILVFVADEPSR